MDFMTNEAIEQSTGLTDDAAKNSADLNFANMRKMLEEERRERIALQVKHEALESEKSKWTKKDPVEEEDEDEPYVDPKTLNKKFGAFRAEMDALIEEKAEKKAQAIMQEDKKDLYLKTNTDFHDTLAPDILQKFADQHPGMAEAILRMPEGFERQKLIYEAIKSTGVNRKEEKSSIQDTINKNKQSHYYSPSGVASAPYSAQGDFSVTGQKKAYEKLQELKSRMKSR